MSTWPTFVPPEITSTLSHTKVGGDSDETKGKNVRILISYNEEHIISTNSSSRASFVFMT